MELSQLYQHREPCYVMLYRTIAQVVIENRFLGAEDAPALRVAPNGICYSHEAFMSHYREDGQRQWILAALRMVCISFVGPEVSDTPWGLIDPNDDDDIATYDRNNWEISGGMGCFRSLVLRAHANRNSGGSGELDRIPVLWA